MTRYPIKTVHLPFRRVCAAGAIFVLLTAAKLAAPEPVSALWGKIQPVLARDTDCAAVFARLGRSLGGGEEQLPAAELTVRSAALWQPAEFIVPLLSAQPLPAPKTATESAEPYAEAVAAFFTAQGEYAALDPPENVSYAAETLPFAYSVPVEGITSSGFGYRLHPLLDRVVFHYGTDFAADSGTPVTAFADGTVYAIGDDPDGYGLYVMLDHGDGWITLYGHCQTLLVSSGSVSRGDPVALVGATGEATGPHLHFELIRDGIYLNPEYYL